LAENDLTTTRWTTLEPRSPSYLFIPQDIDLQKEYERGWKVTEAMPVNAIGMNSHRDFFAIAFDDLTLKTRIKDLVSTTLTDEDIANKYGLINTSDFDLSRARSALRKVKELDQVVVPCLYRPFDNRFVLYQLDILDRPRTEINCHFANKTNLGLVTTRQTREPFATLAVNKICGQHKIVATYDGSSIFPLYLYSEPKNRGLFDNDEIFTNPGGRRPNLSPPFITDISNKLKMQFVLDGKGNLQHNFGPEDILNYMYAVFHSLTFKERYTEFLKIDFPRLPITSSTELFRELCKLGDRLVELHVMEKAGKIITRYPEEGNNIVEKIGYTQLADRPEQNRVWINKTQYFDGVPPEVWEFHVGGYQVCQKWLKDRKGRALSFDDVKHYQRIVAALAETITLMEQIDEVIEEHGGWPIQ